MASKDSEESLTFKAEDFFDREHYANTIISLIKDGTFNKENSSTVIALDSAWGTGKTTFVKKLENKINSEEPTFSCLLYNAWENDYLENAFIPLFYDIIEKDIFETNDRPHIKNLAKPLINIGKALYTDFFAMIKLKEVGSVLAELPETSKKLFMNELDVFESLKEDRDCRKKLIEELTRVTKKSNKKLVVIIDELDRCKPLFAIQTLEVIKHLFDIPNVVFLLSMDFEQLRHSIATVYGQGMDAEGYLRRFVNHLIRLPEPPIDKYISFLLKEYPIRMNAAHKLMMEQNILEAIKSYPGLSIRDINAIYDSYRLFFTHKYKTANLSGLYRMPIQYLNLIIIKYKDIDMYNKLKKGLLLKDANESIKAQNEMSGFYKNLMIFEQNPDGILFCEKTIEEIEPGQVHKVLSSEELRNCSNLNQKHLTPVRYMAGQIEMFTCDNKKQGKEVIYSGEIQSGEKSI